MDCIAHGGRLMEARRRFPEAPAPFIDLSTGINPDAYPFAPPPAAAWCRLPEPEAVAALEAAAARAYGVADPSMVAAAAGTQALIQVLPRAVPACTVAVPEPTYAEHAAAWRAAGARVTDGPPVPQGAAVLCNPNNPDGQRHDPAGLAALARRMRLLVVDEAFADFAPGLSLASLLPLSGVVVLRSFGKAYGLAGLRLGFALAEPDVTARLRALLGPWAVSGPAVAIGTQALDDTAWRDAAQARALAAAERLDGVLHRRGLRVLGGTALFRLAEADADCFGRLARAGILVRTFAARPGWLRFGLPLDETAWQRLEDAL